MPSENDTNKGESTPAATPNRYALTAKERQVLLDLNNGAAQRKLTVYNLNMQLEVACKERDAADALFSGALAMLANSHDLAGGQLAPDFTAITKG